MKINPMHSVHAYQKAQEVGGKKKVATSKNQDRLDISLEAKKMQESSKFSAERQEKVDQVKAKIENGTYEVNAREVAKKFYDYWNN
ncbi:flagellar biosynthesis anti-sigma factor FlgM [Evansella tamaricis]|uniref:Flagellar biosynthesis anti-sigma factor FlgM n=1 Tax=Evansella tamaricis TaxID=2069301 RepID=A0ABS6JDL0_9BACI|nr:flagellar biosynthesis anti-sigma factor FlgM [Evansella tamaricis]MBU9711767.1 flagellar biosynthesis anti-sigma factor FlgM [Evansella tamaricis]